MGGRLSIQRAWAVHFGFQCTAHSHQSYLIDSHLPHFPCTQRSLHSSPALNHLHLCFHSLLSSQSAENRILSFTTNVQHSQQTWCPQFIPIMHNKNHPSLLSAAPAPTLNPLDPFLLFMSFLSVYLTVVKNMTYFGTLTQNKALVLIDLRQTFNDFWLA